MAQGEQRYLVERSPNGATYIRDRALEVALCLVVQEGTVSVTDKANMIAAALNARTGECAHQYTGFSRVCTKCGQMQEARGDE